VTDKNERVNRIRARHILIDYKNDEGSIDSAAAFEQISDIRDRLMNGEDFAALAEEFSEDRGSASKGGDLGFFERRMMVKEFDETAFKLNEGEISDIISTQFGYHIIKLEEIETIPPYADEKQNIRNLYKKTRYKEDYEKYIDALKKEFNYRLIDENIERVVAENDSSIRINDLYWTSGFRNRIKDVSLIGIKDYEISADSVIKHIRDENAFRNLEINNNVLNDAIKKISEDLLLQEKAVQLDKTSPEFADLMEDYRNGIYIFRLQEEEVWDRIKVDTTKLYDFYLSNKEDFFWPDRVDFSEIHSKSDSLIYQYRDLLIDGADFDSLASKVTETFAMAAKSGAYGILNVDENDLSEKAYSLSSEGEFSEPFKYKTGWSIVKLNKKYPSEQKTYEEAKAEVASAYQEWQSKLLEEEYINRLKSVYEPKVYYDRLNKAFKESESEK
jgi:peptidyl-prolyl cis-trans isomerase SurA